VAKQCCANSCVAGQLLHFFGNLPPCVMGMEACASAHHWARPLQRFGHTVRLMAP
jgi:transposase